MASPSTSTLDNKGFTFLEVMIVVAIIIILFYVTAPVGVDTYRAYALRSERSMLVSVIERTRSRAIANYYASPWVTCVTPTSYQIKKGSTCTGGTTQDTVPLSSTVSFGGTFPVEGIAFSQLAGTTTVVALDMQVGSRSSTININGEGTINW